MRRTALLGALAALALAAPAARLGAQFGVNMGTIEEDPKFTHEKLKQKAEADYKEGMKARGAGSTEEAVRILIRVAKMETQIDSPYPEKAFNELKTIVEEAQKELQVARQLIAGEDPVAGMGELKRITRTYMGLWPAKEAGALMRLLDADPQFQATLRAGRLAEELKKAEAVEAQAEAILNPPKAEPQEPAKSVLPGPPPPPKPEGVSAVSVRPKERSEPERRAARLERLLVAYEAYGRIVQQGADTEPGKKAADARTRLEKDADFMARLREAQAERKARELLSLAEGYFRSGRFDSAREYCKKILAEFPKTPQATDARMILERIK